jgi:hypothetical protein
MFIVSENGHQAVFVNRINPTDLLGLDFHLCTSRLFIVIDLDLFFIFTDSAIRNTWSENAKNEPIAISINGEIFLLFSSQS